MGSSLAPGRKSRMVWTLELHNQFVDCVQRLGGHKEATPKEIVKLMRVNGLTSEHVKSHLQKYRAYWRGVENAGAGVGGGSSSAAGDPSGGFRLNGDNGST